VDLIDNTFFQAPFRKYILSNDHKDYLYNNTIDDKIDYYAFNDTNVRTDSEFYQLS